MDGIMDEPENACGLQGSTGNSENICRYDFAKKVLKETLSQLNNTTN